MQTAPAFPPFCIDGFLEPAFAQNVHDAFPSYAEAARRGTSFKAVNEKRKIQVTDARLFAPPFRRLHELLASDAFVERMSCISRCPSRKRCTPRARAGAASSAAFAARSSPAGSTCR